MTKDAAFSQSPIYPGHPTDCIPSSMGRLPVWHPQSPLDTSCRSVSLPITRLIGRQQEVRELGALLRRPEVRLVTLTGTAGIGKTRLAWQMMIELQEVFPAGCYFVSLVDIYTDELLILAIIQTLGLPKAEMPSSFEHLVTFLQHQPLLLILDNFEQLVAAAPTLVNLLSACPLLKLLLTSRAVLRVQGEYEFQVPPLALPDLTHLPDTDQLAQYPAIALFLERAQAVKHGFQLTRATDRCIAEICTCLDGLPLAIELAAARIKLLSPRALLARLEHRLEVLTSGGPDLPARQQTLRTALNWSYDLLSAEAQWLFRHLAVFVGGCQLEAIEALCDPLEGTSTPVLDLVTALLDQHLLARSNEPGEEPRFFLFETLREYSLECLISCGELDQARAAHATYFTALVREAELSFFGFPPASWLDAVEHDYSNVRAALEYFLEQQKTVEALRLSGMLGAFWFFRGHLSEGRRFLVRALAASGEDSTAEPDKAQAHALYMAGWLALWQLDFSEAGRCLRQGLDLFQTLSDSRGRAAVLNLLSVIEESRGNRQVAEAMTKEALQLCQEIGEQKGVAAILLIDGMQALFRSAFAWTQKCCAESLAVFSRLGDSWGVAANLHYLGWAFYCQGEIAIARQYSEEGVARLRTFGIPSLTAEAMTVLGYEVATQGEEALAASLFDEALMLARAVGNPITTARILCGLGHLALRQQQMTKAHELFQESGRLLTGMERFARARLVFASCLEGWGEIAWAQGQASWAVTCFSLAEAQSAVQDSAALLGILHPWYAPTLAAVRAHFDEGTFARLWTEGRTMTLEQIRAAGERAFLVEQTSIHLPSQATTRSRLTTPDKLTGREVTILALLVEGLTNNQIAERLTLSPHTVSVHVQAIYRKLGVSSRSQATHHAIKHGLV